MSDMDYTPPSNNVKTVESIYTQENSTTSWVNSKSNLNTSISIGLLTEVAGVINTSNAKINELNNLVNALIDDLQSAGIVK